MFNITTYLDILSEFVELKANLNINEIVIAAININILSPFLEKIMSKNMYSY